MLSPSGDTADSLISENQSVDQLRIACISQLPQKTLESILTVSVREAAELLGLTKETIREEIRSGRLKALRPGKSKWVIRIADLRVYLNTMVAKEHKRFNKPGGFHTNG